MGSALIPSNLGGEINYTGATDDTGNVEVKEASASETSQIRIQNTYSDRLVNDKTGPSIFQVGAINNPAGLINISVANGAYVQTASVVGRQVLIEVPNGPFISYQPDSYWAANQSRPEYIWRNKYSPETSINDAVIYAANYVYKDKLDNSNDELFYQSHPDYDMDGQSIIVFGSCLPGKATESCKASRADDYTGLYTKGFKDWVEPKDKRAHVPIIPRWTLSTEVADFEDVNHPFQNKIDAGEAVGIVAREIDLNGTIESGRSLNHTLTFENEGALDVWLESQRKANGNQGFVEIPSHDFDQGKPIWWGFSEGVKPMMDLETGAIHINEVNATGGGYVFLKGRILNTHKTASKINVNTGYGSVDINNKTDYDLYIDRVDAGQGSEGVVKIADTEKNETTWFRYSQDRGLSRLVADGVESGIEDASESSILNGRTASYSPKKGLRYFWEQSTQFEREWLGHENGVVSDWSWEDGANPDYNYEYWVGVDDSKTDVAYESSISGYLGSYRSVTMRYGGCDDGYGSNCNYGFKASKKIDDTWKSRWQYRFPTSGFIKYRSSARADYPVAINFHGSNESKIQINSGGNLQLEGDVISNNGDVSLKAGGNIDGYEENEVRGSSITLSAEDGGVGTANKALRLSLVENDGSLDVKATDTVNLMLESGARIDRLDAGEEGDVIVRAGRSLTGGTRETDVQGRNIDIRVNSGGIGHLGIKAHEEILPDGRVLGGRVTLEATNDISITERAGDLWIEKIDAGTGNVSIEVTDGGLQDANQRSAQSTLTEEQVQAVWDRLSLTEAYGADEFVRANTVPAFERSVERYYQDYWRLLSMGSATGDGFELNDESVSRYRMMAEARTGETNLTESALNQMAADQFVEAREFFTQTLGESWAQGQAFTKFDHSFRYEATQAQIDNLMREAVWTESELRHAVAQSALGSKGTTPVGRVENPTIKGNNLSLDIANEIGHLDDPIRINYDDLVNGNLTLDQAGALALANEAGDVSILEDADGNPLALSVLQTAPLFTQSSGAVDLFAGGNLYLQANDILEFSGLEVNGSARLAATDSIIGQNYEVLKIAGDLGLVAGDGNISDSNGNPMILQVGGKLERGSAGGMINLHWARGDLAFGTINAEEDVSVYATNGALYSTTEDVTHVTGQNITLSSVNDLGESLNPLKFQLSGAGNTLKAESEKGSIWLETDEDAAIERASANRGLTLSAGGDLDLTELLAHNGELRLQVAGLINADTGTDLHIEAPNTTTNSFIEAGGSIGTENAPLKASLGALSELVSLGGGVHLDLASGLSTDALSASAGPVTITGNQNLSVGTLAVGTTQAAGQSGYFEALVAGLTMGAADIAGYADVESSGSISLGDTTVGDHVHLVADGPLAFTELAAGDDASLQTSGDITGAGITADNLTINAGGSIASAASLLRYTFNEGAGELTGSAKAGGAWLQSASTTQLNSFSTGGDFKLQLMGADNPSLDITNHVSAGEGLHIETAGDIALNRIESGSGIFQLLSGGAIKGYDSSEAQIMAAASAPGSRIRAVSDIGEPDVPLRVSLGQIDSVESDQGSIWLHQLDGWSVGQLMATNGDTRIAGNGLLAAETINTGHLDVQVDELDIGHADANGDAYLKAAEGDLAIRGLRASGKADLESAATVSFGYPEQDDAPLTPADLDIGTTLNVRAEDDIRGGNAISGDTMELVAGQELIFGRLESLGLDLLLEAGTDITGARAIAARDLGIVAGGRLKVDDTRYGGSLSLRAGRDLTIGTGEDIVLTGAIEAGRDITVTSGEAINMESLRAGRDVYLEADGDINIEKFLSAGADVASEYDIYDTGNLTLLSTGNVTVGEDVRANGTMDIQVDGNLQVAGEMTALERINAVTGENLEVAGGIQSRASSVWLDTGASLVTPELLAGSWLDVTTGGSELALERALANEEVNIRVGTADGQNYAPDGSLAINELAGDWIQLDSGNSVSIDQARSQSALEIASAYINVGQLDHTGTGSLAFNAKGRVAEPAIQLTATINADAVESELYRVRDTRLSVSGEQVRFDQAEYIDRFDMQTPSAHLLADNVNPVYAGANVQLREQDKAFWFDQNNTVTQTNAFVLHRDYTHQVMVPNYMEDHESEGGVMYGGSSAARYADRTQQQMNARVDLTLPGQSRAPMPGYDLSDFLEFGLTVNLRNWERMMDNGVMVGSTEAGGADNEI